MDREKERYDMQQSSPARSEPTALQSYDLHLIHVGTQIYVKVA